MRPLSDHFKPRAAEQDYFTTLPGSDNMNPHTHSAGWSTVREPSQTAFPAPVQSANAPVSPVSPDDYFSGDGFFFSRDVDDAWVGAETTNPEPYCDYDRLFSPLAPALAPAPAPADGHTAANVPGAMCALPRPKRSRSQISKADPSSPASTTSVQTTQRHRIRSESGKPSRQMQQQHEVEAATPTVTQHEIGSGDETTLDALRVKEVRIRRTHNLVEKQYRNRLNAQFERLLAVLPAKPSEQEEDEEEQRQRGEAGPDGVPMTVPVPDRIISKAEVLRMARQRIKTLEQQNRELLQRQSELTWKLEATGGAAAAAAAAPRISQ